MRVFYAVIKFLSVFTTGFLLLEGSAHAQLVVADSLTAAQLVNYLTGDGVVVLNPEVNSTCPLLARGKFNFNGATSPLGIDSGIVLTSGSAETFGSNYGMNAAVSNFASYGFPATTGIYAPGDADLNSLLSASGSSSTTNDACVLEFDFVPAGDTIKFQYVFGSEEYPEYACSGFNDVFGFFISGIGYTGLNNIAKVPNTNIPVSINSINNATSSNNSSIATCNAMGTGSPFGAYYVDNLNNNGQVIVYDGFTTVLTAAAQVSPCDTYHLKIAIADAGDAGFDSGVMLKAGSLTSTALTVKTVGGGGLETPYTNTVRGCPPGTVRVSRNGSLSQPLTVPLSYSGTAVNGVDYVFVPSSVTIPAGDSVATVLIDGIPISPAVGPKSVIVSILSPYVCSGQAPIVIASDTIMIYDSIYVEILTPDTAICRGRSVNLQVEADSTLAFQWTPAATVADSTVQNATVTPTATTTYTVQITLPFSGNSCYPASSSVTIKVKDTPQVDLGPDKVTCGDTVQLYANTSPTNPDESFSWSPATGLSSTIIRNPTASVPSTTTYVVTVNPGAVGCDGYDSIVVRLLPDHITVLNNDTVVCAGTQIQLRVDGDTAFAYNWDPEQDIANPLIPNSVLTAQTSGYYTVTASHEDCSPMPDSFYVEVQPVPQVYIGENRVICTYDTIQFYGAITPAGYPNYTLYWSPGNGLNDSTIINPVFSGDESITQFTLKVTTPLGCMGADTVSVTVYPGDFLSVTPMDTGFCPPDSVQFTASGANQYLWSPDYKLSAATIANPVASPEVPVNYSVVGTKVYGTHSCYDTQYVAVNVHPNAVLNLPDSVTIWSGEKYQIDPGGNCLYFSWFPPSGLSADNIGNPIAGPEVRTRYFVNASTEHGCKIYDSIDVLVNTESVLDAPNAFAPTAGDFKILRRGRATLKYFRVFNRWGNKVFETTDIDRGWDGTHNGQPQPVGVYVYSIDAETITGMPFRKDGTVTLLK
ncbi:MAG: choice-of-anchor L domain-containing protein [Edaphocola sp.]